MPHMPPLDTQSASFILPPHIHPWLRAVVAFGFISFIASISLLVVLTYKLVSWKLKSKRSNQFVILIFNLLWADIQQALAFLLNVEWLRLGSVQIENPICFAQGWLVSTGDLGSGLFPWVSMARTSTFDPGVWCWIHHELNDLRLWTHYIWIFVFEFGTVIIYLTIYTILLHRLHNHYYTPAAAKRVKSISNLMVVYPLVYVVCTIPLASSRMAAMSGSPPSLVRLCLSGAMITSNGWLDVLLYTLTRRIMIFSDEPPPDDNGFDTFSTFWATQPRRFGGECTISADGVTLPSCNESSDDLCNTKDIKLVTTTEVKSEPAGPEDFAELERRQRPRTPIGRWSEDSGQLSLKLEDFESSRSDDHLDFG
ncbi:hypothetical protein SNOG_00683 [Parastagonospora nodorum SN15]|uniref:G protein-coupled receptor GPR1/2/3 C-terminal domain-containing protein n=1 Tax=Phaeosphaeria nodorum (strain SN15 / ATCC MYA-4574 / FGSC 10173) TaxID=321614 RepID=Q0V5N1_PHANO|nr:hypothetical protein SNOG_00683 [Parastagonospora nodorum SN15]EAT92178.2 hypothetical protein SNOG_00683 [Parastagonospora nodorum SN15]